MSSEALTYTSYHSEYEGESEEEEEEEEEMDNKHNNNNNNNRRKKKRVMVVIDESSGAKQAMVWALTHVAHNGDLLTLLHVLHKDKEEEEEEEEAASHLANSLVSLCKACKPEVQVEALVIQGPRLDTVLRQVKKLEASVLVLSQRKPSLLSCLFRGRREEFVEECINRAACLTMAVRKQREGVGGYLVSTKWQKNFWLLA